MRIHNRRMMLKIAITVGVDFVSRAALAWGDGGRMMRIKERNGKTVITFGQESVPRAFFKIARDLGYRVAVTGGVTLTHEIVCSEVDFETLIELAFDL